VFGHTTAEEIYHHSLLTPFQVIQAPDVPHTLNGKRVEVLVKKVGLTIHRYILSHFICIFFAQIINGAPLSSVNLATLSNPECLKFYQDIGEILRKEIDG